MKVTVRSGDTFFYYSQLFAIPLTLIVHSNQHVKSHQLSIGEQIAIPGFQLGKYKIKKNDTIWKIAKLRHLLPDALFLVNGNIDPENLQIGTEIAVPLRVTTPIVNWKKTYDYSALRSDLGKLKEIYPFLQVNTIGKSVLNRSLSEIRIGVGNNLVHINGSFHANEWITTIVIMTFLNDYLLSLTNMSQLNGSYMEPLYNHSQLSIVPMVNPDGVDLVLNGPPKNEPYKQIVVDINNGSLDFSNWKANIRGVDLNNQFPANWEIEKERKEPKQPAPRDYPGDKPLSEPEVIAIANLTKAANFSRVLAFHTQGKEIYWGYERLEPLESEMIVNEFSRVSGYKAVRYIDSHAGYKDWFIQEWHRPGFTIELGEGVNPLPMSQFDEIYRESLGIFIASMYM